MKEIRYQKNQDYLFVDGYNIINFWKCFNKEESLEDQRRQLIDILMEYSHTTKEQIILVFDGYMVKKSKGAFYKEGKLILIFTKEFETADHFIERQLNYIGRYRKIRVATSDNIEQQIILSRGGIRISAREFEVEVENAMKKIEKSIVKLQKNSKLSIMEEQKDKLQKLKKQLKNNGS